MFKKLNALLKKITTRRTKPTITSFNLEDFLPENPEKEDFYRYNGSLTTPGCNQVVTWTVFKGCMTFQPLNSTPIFSNMKQGQNFCPLPIL
ncbi:MAG: carbonic anhydrase family protein, partial [Bacteroidetes bacterium]|nr:carbonic anhydrase family protein [Bacteroidota bacterium]